MRALAVAVVIAAGCGGSRRAAPVTDASPSAAASGDGGVRAPPAAPAPTADPGASLLAFDVPELPAPTASKLVTQNPVEPDPCTLPPDARFAAIADPPPAPPADGDDGAPPLVAVRCGRLIPHAQVARGDAALLTLVHRGSAERHELTIERLPDETAGTTNQPDGGAGSSGPTPVAHIPLPLRGARLTVRLPNPGLYRVRGATPEETAHILVAAHPWATVVTGARVRFAPLPAAPRSYDVVVTEVAGREVLRRHQAVTAEPIADEGDPGN